MTDPTVVTAAAREFIALDWTSASVVIGFLALLVLAFLAHTLWREFKLGKREELREREAAEREERCQQRNAQMQQALLDQGERTIKAIDNNTKVTERVADQMDRVLSRN